MTRLVIFSRLLRGRACPTRIAQGHSCQGTAIRPPTILEKPLRFELMTAFSAPKRVRFEVTISVISCVCNKSLSSFPRFFIFLRRLPSAVCGLVAAALCRHFRVGGINPPLHPRTRLKRHDDKLPSSSLSNENERVGKDENNAKNKYLLQWNQWVVDTRIFHIAKIRPPDVAF